MAGQGGTARVLRQRGVGGAMMQQQTAASERNIQGVLALMGSSGMLVAECYPRDRTPAMRTSLADRILTHFDGTVSQLGYLWH